jgi:nitric oxide dioxygenase
MLNPSQIEKVQISYEKIIPIADDASQLFYEHLFSLQQELRPYFPSELEGQKCKLMSTLQFTVYSLGEANALVQPLQALGARHVNYGARPGHYVAVARALVAMLEDCLGDEFDQAAHAAWVTLIQTISQNMQNIATGESRA